MLTISNLTYRIAGREILTSASVSVAAGHHAGLVGRNGAGKSTLLKIISGDLQADSGTIDVPKHWRIGRLEQEMKDQGRSLLSCVLAADSERTSLMAEAEHASDPHRIAEIHARLADIQAHSAEARAAEILAGLGFDAAAQQRPLSDFSGGWQMRVALAAQLFSAPDLMLLDEPTNHLDLEATLWLESYLKTYPGTILLVSHDRDLLNKVVNRIIHLNRGSMTLYTGGYDDFENMRRLRMEQDMAMAAKIDAQRKHMMAFVDRFRYKASKARQAQSRLKMIAKLQPISVIAEEKGVNISFPQPEALPPPLITLDRVSVGYEPGKPILRNLDLRLDPDDRIALLGANGNGKSTFVKLLAGRLAAMSGEVRKSSKIRVGYFAQHQTDELDLEATPVEIMGRAAPELLPDKRRAHLGRFGIGQDQALTRVRELSGGEKARLLLALMSRQSPNILLLDEPSNHLDIESRQALVEAINEFEGAVIVISHDPNLIELSADRLWLVKDGAVKPFDGDMEDYRRLIISERRERQRSERQVTQRKGALPEKAAAPKSAAAHGAAPAPKPKAAAQPPKKPAISPEKKKALAGAETAIAKLTQALDLIEGKLADPALYNNGGTAELATWQTKHAEVKKKLAEAEEKWLELSAG
ncbi:ATP-binding cassette subfamily F protein 3 [Dongia mobilis]|uniref:ATP-binding cassette subfamily F protein 3 n=1 Tax=Dongia mobilis TaxID=578943 RepID=A0A4R6WKH4_9PROT|nr:ABC-F family ATP-binding cassette domain-containing protein [Dongia mobilis]TDQ78587.1 ATP-binding cassette subfamily F protein 3 [Dongia mobilis]